MKTRTCNTLPLLNPSSSILTCVMFSISVPLFAEEKVDEHLVVHGSKPDYVHHLADTLPLNEIELDPLSQFGSAADALIQAPEVTLNGQGGLLQTLSIRGLSRWRIQTLVEGVPIHSERRAGNAAEFIAPSLLGRSYVLPGAASTQLGSGALGGGIDLRLATSFDTQITSALGLEQDYREVSSLGGKEFDDYAVNWGVSYRHANNSHNADNELLIDGFEQTLGWTKFSSDSSLIKELLFLYSTANDVGKASSDLPSERITEYPSNDHWLAKLELNWLNATVYAHHFALDTDVLRPESRFNDLANSALSWGSSIGDNFALSDWTVNWKLALDARSQVEALERELSSAGELVFDRANLIANQQAYSLSFDATRNWHDFQVSSGIRAEHLVQSDSSTGVDRDSEDTNVSAFVAGRYHLNDQWSVALYSSSAFRVPVLTERFFNGSTPRGITLGDENLVTEKGKNVQFDVDYQSEKLQFGISASKQFIDNYIERIDISDELQQYVNLGDAQIEAINYEFNWALSAALTMRLNGQWLWGEDDNGSAINDISPHQHDLNLTYQTGAFETWFKLSYRQAFDRPGSSELALPSAVFMKIGATAFLSDSINISAQINNLTDKVYAVSTDDLSPLARGRDAQLSLTYWF